MRLSFLLLLLALPAPAASISGQLVDGGTGSPIAGARLRVGTQNAEPTYAKGDDAGRFRIDGLSPGIYFLRVQALGYLEAERPVALQQPGTRRRARRRVCRSKIRRTGRNMRTIFRW